MGDSLNNDGDPPVPRVGLIDDVPNELDRSRRALEAVGCSVNATSNPKDVGRVLLESEDGLVLDARLEHFEVRSVDIARTYSRMQPGSPIVLVSDFLSDGTYDKMPNMVTPLAKFYRFDKAGLETEEVRGIIAEELMASALEAPLRPRQQADVVNTEEIRDLLVIPPAVWSRLGPDKQDDIAADIENAVGPSVQRLLAEADIDWIVVGGEQADVLRWGTGPHPADALLDEIQASEGCVPFFFARELEVDSISLDGIPWPGTSKNPDYPSLHVRFDGGTQVGQELLFDTGADANYLDRQLVGIENLRAGNRPRTGYRLGQAVRYRDVVASITLHDGRGTVDGTTTFRAVKNWRDSIGKDKELPGLFSTRVLVDLQTAVRICGRRKMVSLDDAED